MFLREKAAEILDKTANYEIDDYLVEMSRFDLAAFLDGASDLDREVVMQRIEYLETIH